MEIHPGQPAAASVERIDACLPQTQCTLCGYPGCLAYAEALFANETDINRCPPGGSPTIQALSSLLDSDVKPLAGDCEPFPGRQMARIREADCIGCTLCLEPCPVDAIIGAAKHMHVVLIDECTGCQLCISYCPVDCIEMVNHAPSEIGEIWTEFGPEEVSRWRSAAERRRQRVLSLPPETDNALESEQIRQQIRESVNRERSRRWNKARQLARRSVIRDENAV